MARRPTSTPPTLRAAVLNEAQIRAGIPKIERRIAELQNLDVNTLTDETGSAVLDALAAKINDTIRAIFETDTHEYLEYKVSSLYPTYPIYLGGGQRGLRAHLREARAELDMKALKLRTLIDVLSERLEEEKIDETKRTVRAYDGLELHPEIARRASKLYRDGHYANAVEAAVKALNGLVRLRSDLELDGSKLMEAAFNPKNPVLKFNALADQSDQDEQRGFMMLFFGAVAGLRNPRAHGFINDDPERALEFIAFVSLLAKLLDGVVE